MARTTSSDQLGQRLRQLRGKMSLRDLARQSGVDHSTISRYESNQVTPSLDALTKILDVFGVQNSERERLVALTRRETPTPGRLVAGVPSTGRQLAQLIGYERSANRITEVAPLLIPGILQTEDYARAVLSQEPATERRVRMRLERAEIITRAKDPVELHVILHMGALTQRVAPPETIQAQLLHLLRMAERPNITIQVMPADMVGYTAGLAGPFMVIEFPEAAPLVHLEHHRAGAFLWEEGDVRSFIAAAQMTAQKAMTPARSAEVIEQMAGMETT